MVSYLETRSEDSLLCLVFMNECITNYMCKGGIIFEAVKIGTYIVRMGWKLINKIIVCFQNSVNLPAYRTWSLFGLAELCFDIWIIRKVIALVIISLMIKMGHVVGRLLFLTIGWIWAVYWPWLSVNWDMNINKKNSIMLALAFRTGEWRMWNAQNTATVDIVVIQIPIAMYLSIIVWIIFQIRYLILILKIYK